MNTPWRFRSRKHCHQHCCPGELSGAVSILEELPDGVVKIVVSRVGNDKSDRHRTLNLRGSDYVLHSLEDAVRIASVEDSAPNVYRPSVNSE